MTHPQRKVGTSQSICRRAAADRHSIAYDASVTIERQSAIARPIPAVLPPINASLPLVSHPSCKLHAIYDADADRPIYAEVTPAKVNEISVAQEMPIEAGAAAEVLAYVFPEHAAFFREKAEEATR